MVSRTVLYSNRPCLPSFEGVFFLAVMEFVNDGTDERARVQVDTTWALIGVV